jgi:hypothetical protein
MVFWAIVGVVILLALFAAWRKDRKHRSTISRRQGNVESDIGKTWGYYQ